MAFRVYIVCNGYVMVGLYMATSYNIYPDEQHGGIIDYRFHCTRILHCEILKLDFMDTEIINHQKLIQIEKHQHEPRNYLRFTILLELDCLQFALNKYLEKFQKRIQLKYRYVHLE